MSKKIVILGGGESGCGAAVLAQQKGYNVFLSDASLIENDYKNLLNNFQIKFEEGKHDMEKILAADEVVKSPGIPEKAAVMQAIRQKNIPVISEIELAYRYVGDSFIIAISGSNGKTTTTSLIYNLYRVSQQACALVGNIGTSFAYQVAINPEPVYVLEVSSFQLDDIQTFRPNIAVLTNITADHLDRYNYNFQNYINSKFKLVQNQTANDLFVYNMDDEVIMNYLSQNLIVPQKAPISMKQPVTEGAYISNQELHVKWKSEEFTMSVNDFALKGKHNQYNSMAASMVGVAADIRKPKIREALQVFEGIEHRMEFVATIRGVDFINDSKATNVNSAWFALESVEKPVVLILGGIDKGNDYTPMLELVEQKVKAIVCLGTDNEKIHKAFGGITKAIVDTNSAEAAVQAAFNFAVPGDVVLLSPACASFDLFKNFEDRGTQFKQAVKNL